MGGGEEGGEGREGEEEKVGGREGTEKRRGRRCDGRGGEGEWREDLEDQHHIH